jgi:hypothetical protein
LAHVFISFVEENVKLVNWIVQQLRANSLDPWFSKEPGRITPGDQWKQTLRSAVRQGGFYLPVFTRQWHERERTVANEELIFAVEEARLRGLHRRWLIPLKADDQPIPAIDLGGGLTLADLQYVDIPQLGWERGLKVLFEAMGVANPVLEAGAPLAHGFGSAASISGGFVTYRNTNPRVDELEGVTFTATSGWVRRDDAGKIYAKFLLRSPFEDHQRLNADLGFDSIDVMTDAAMISTKGTEPTHFYYVDEKDRRGPGSPLWELGVKKPMLTTVAMEQQTGYDAYGYLNSDDRLIGTFRGYVETRTALGNVRFTFDGDFDLAMKAAFLPPDAA